MLSGQLCGIALYLEVTTEFYHIFDCADTWINCGIAAHPLNSIGYFFYT